MAAVDVIVADLTFTGWLGRLAARGPVWFQQRLGIFFLLLNLFSIVFVKGKVQQEGHVKEK